MKVAILIALLVVALASVVSAGTIGINHFNPAKYQTVEDCKVTRDNCGRCCAKFGFQGDVRGMLEISCHCDKKKKN